MEFHEIRFDKIFKYSFPRGVMAKGKKEKNYKLYFYGVIIALIFLAILNFDFQIAQIITGMRGSFLDGIMLVFAYTITSVIALVCSGIIVFIDNKKRVLKLLLSLVLTGAIAVIMKLIVARPRPFAEGISTLSSLIKASYTKWDFSFISLHSALIFAALPFMPKKWFWPWLIFSALMAFSRVYFGLHYLSDVIAGGITGLLIAYIVIKKVK
jgi:undecaprenyl-diphosphatase